MMLVLRGLAASAVLLLLKSYFHPTWDIAVSSLMIAFTLTWLTARSQDSGAMLVLILTGVYFILVALVNVPEGVLFDVIPIKQAPQIMARAIIHGFILAVTIAVLFGRFKPARVESAFERMPLVALLWRLPLAMAVFMACTIVAGLIVIPFVKDFYASKVLPEPTAMLFMCGLRAAAMVVAGLLLVHGLKCRRDAAAILSVAFPVIGVLALLVQRSDVLPPQVRLVHMAEMLPYYILIGFILALLFGPKNWRAPAEA